MALPDEDTSAGQVALPEDWQEATVAHGERLLVPNLQTQRKQAIFVAIITGGVQLGSARLGFRTVFVSR
jgi:hypothetical protein